MCMLLCRPLYRIDAGKRVFYALDEAERLGVLDRIKAEKNQGCNFGATF